MPRLRFLFLMVACFLPLIGALAYFYWAPSRDDMRIFYSLSKGLQFTLPIIVWALYKPGIVKNIQQLFRLPQNTAELKSTLQWTFWASAFFLVCGYFAYIYVFRSVLYAPGLKDALSTKLLDFGVHSVFDYYVLAFLISVIHSFLEEYYWRAYVHVEFESLFAKFKSRKWLMHLPVLCSSLAFTLHHIVMLHRYAQIDNKLFMISFACVIVYLCGVLWAFMYMRFRNVYAVWISHIAADIVMVGIGYDVLYR